MLLSRDNDEIAASAATGITSPDKADESDTDSNIADGEYVDELLEDDFH